MSNKIDLAKNKNPTLKSPLIEMTVNQLGMDVVFSECCDDEYITLLCKHPLYAVCKVNLSLQLASAPNYRADVGTLCAPLSVDGLNEILHWTDRHSAVSRYTRLTGNHSSTSLWATPAP